MVSLPGLVCRSSAMLRVAQQVTALAPTNLSVLVTGESGTGKELIARALHELSGRKGRFIVVDCGALPPTLVESELFGHARGAFTGAHTERSGLLEEGDGGTVFFDEISELPLHLEPRLLRVIQERTVRRLGSRQERRIDLRFVSASNRDLLVAMNAREFRSDLYFRLCAFNLQVPSLRERPDDIPLLARHFLARHPERSFTPAAIDVICAYRWPGNARELEHWVERMTVLSTAPLIGEDEVKEHLPAAAVALPIRSNHFAMKEVRREAIIRALSATDQNVLRAAKLLGIGKTTLYRYMEELHIEKSVTPAPRPLRPDYVVMWNENNCLVEVSDPVCDLLEFSREELINKHHSEVCVPNPAIGEELFREVRERGELSGFYVLKTRTGREIEILFMSKQLDNGLNRTVWTLL